MKRKGFTLVELLVVIAIIGMLVGLLLPAVQQAREAARQMQCSNHLRQLGLAALNHESTNRHFPTGGWFWYWIGDPDRGFGKDQPGCWTFTLLPFLEQNGLFQQASDGDPHTVTAEQKAAAQIVLETPLSVFHCPSRRAVKTYPLSSDMTTHSYNFTPGTTIARTDFAGNWGSQQNVPQGAKTPASLEEAKTMNAKNTWETTTQSGIIYRRSVVRMGEISDGTTNTYLLGEKYLQNDHYETGKGGGDNEGLHCGGVDDNHRVCYYVSPTVNTRPYQDRAGFTAHYHFGSSHSATFGMTMCDGSVQRITYAIDAELHQYLGDRSDRTPASIPQ
ncbi:MAG: DUF1559 domain-containing protein [Planctomycetia bacterium]|nr:DUF1559 domain-containing protein [Planctomycetia bacterium]